MNIQLVQVDKYINYIKSIDLNNASEHTYRTPLENLLKEIKFQGLDIVPVHEGKDKSLNIDGTPDFIIYKDDGTFFKSLVGFIECKKIAYDLENLKNSAQIDKYSKTSENILITNYREFILLNKGKEVNKVVLLDNNFNKPKNQNAYQEFINLLREFYNYEYQYIKDKKTLANALAAQSFYYSVALRKYIENTSRANDKYYQKFNALFLDFQNSMQYSYVLEDFCDIYSQSLVYGLFLSRLEAEEILDEKKVSYLVNIPEHFELLYEFLEAGYSNRYLPPHIKQALISIGKNINHINIPKIQEEFKNETNNKSDISVYLYEDFLKEYDAYRQTEKRKEGGVYYTPKEVSEFIIRAVNDLIISDFELPQGFMSENVKFLDFACGTGTFIQSIFDVIFKTIYKNKLDDLDKNKIKHKVLNDIYGFELLFTPYIIAHTILFNYLKEKKIYFEEKDRLKIYLTNTLDIGQHTISNYLPQMKTDHEESHEIKSFENLLAIVGNPPYFNGKSQALPEINNQLLKYKAGLNEQKINLDDMYIKFIRFAEWKMEKAGSGIVGIITNNSFLDGITHRQMRKHLYETFDEIYILNLHGNTRKGEINQNIFDIMVGVSILIFVKHKVKLEKTKISYFSTLDNKIVRRKNKLEFLKTKKLKEVDWLELNPEETDSYWFVKKDFKYLDEYKKFWKITDIFNEYGSANKTERDIITIHYNKIELEKVINDFINLSEQDIKSKYKLKDSRDWKVSYAKEDLIKNQKFDLFHKISYRPLDFRITYFTSKSRGFIGTPSKISKYIQTKKNLVLCFTKSFSNPKYTNVLISNTLVDIHYCSDQVYTAPLYIYQDNTEDETFGLEFRTENFTKEFVAKYLEQIDFKPTPEKILAYIYAVMHSPIYREKYIEFLKTDFPSVPMTSDAGIFEKYAILGQKLVDLHLLKNLPIDREIKVTGEIKPCEIIKILPPTEIESVLRLVTKSKKFINYENVDLEIYNFEIGTYKPIDKWLKYRIKDDVELNLEDFEHIKKMIIVIKNTISIMQEIKSLGEEYLT